MNAPGDGLVESTSWLVWGLYWGFPWYCRWKSKQRPVCPECPCIVDTGSSVPPLRGWSSGWQLMQSWPPPLLGSCHLSSRLPQVLRSRAPCLDWAPFQFILSTPRLEPCSILPAWLPVPPQHGVRVLCTPVACDASLPVSLVPETLSECWHRRGGRGPRVGAWTHGVVLPGFRSSGRRFCTHYRDDV